MANRWRKENGGSRFDAVLSVLNPLSSILASVFVSALGQILRAQDEAFDALTACNPFHDFGQVGHCHVAVEEVIGLNQNANTARTLVEATRGAGAGPKWRQPARGQLFLQSKANLFGAFLGTRPFFILRTPAIGADEEVSLSLRHVRRLTADSPSVNGGPQFGVRPLYLCPSQIAESSGRLSASQRKGHL